MNGDEGRSHTLVVADGTRLAVREVGSRPAPLTVVFVHGFCLHAGAWAPQQRYLSRQWGERARLVFFDHRGHGGSGGADAGTYTISQLGRDVEEIIRVVAPTGPVVLVGHSMGGMAVLSYLAQHADSTSRVVGVGLISTALSNVAGAGIGRALNTPAVSLLGGACARAPRLVGRSWSLSRRLLTPVIGATCPMAPSLGLRAAATSYEMVHATPIATVAAFLRDLRLYDASAAVGALGRMPVSIMCGTRDRVTPILHSQQLAALLPNAELVAVAGDRHMVGLEQPQVVGEALDRLLVRAQTYHREHSPTTDLVGA
ncbi:MULTISPECIES: alpha/beta fold hydrolase [Rhodococcus]|uniref:alpha/beta fold hydrolase n=1 Tax=Rhodococcus TaxID=1827 RepID=UPI0007181935|nr:MULTISPECIES: alpha/beta hydrolase [Rhodococcus]MCZ4618108.1 alpha/beta hydrolase [Rhodococcus qingshengii]MEA1798495.1 alpha/beta hydrolase [Rhodococcus qingshengii]ORI19756.1 alpha/beta hydrolase [Rhodococcus erythropolis]